MNGYMGTIIRVDLSKGTIKKEPLNMEAAKDFVGARGLGTKYFCDEVDPKIRQLMGKMRREDVLILTADHGCDPGFPGTDHTREYVPCLCFGEHLKKGCGLGIRHSYADIAATIADIFNISFQGDGESFWSDITENVDDSYRYLL